MISNSNHVFENDVTGNTEDGIGIVGDGNVVEGNMVTGNLRDGIAIVGKNDVIIDNDITDNVRHGVIFNIFSGVGNSARFNRISDNGGKGLESVVDMNATNNWWGDATGPTHPTITAGAGQEVSAKAVVTPSAISISDARPNRYPVIVDNSDDTGVSVSFLAYDIDGVMHGTPLTFVYNTIGGSPMTGEGTVTTVAGSREMNLTQRQLATYTSYKQASFEISISDLDIPVGTNTLTIRATDGELLSSPISVDIVKEDTDDEGSTPFPGLFLVAIGMAIAVARRR